MAVAGFRGKNDNSCIQTVVTVHKYRTQGLSPNHFIPRPKEREGVTRKKTRILSMASLITTTTTTTTTSVSNIFVFNIFNESYCPLRLLYLENFDKGVWGPAGQVLRSRVRGLIRRALDVHRGPVGSIFNFMGPAKVSPIPADVSPDEVSPPSF